MTIEELKLNNIKNLTDFEILVYRSRQNGILYVPDIISNIAADIASLSNPTNAIVLNSNFGEISSKLKNIKNVVSIDINSSHIEISKYLNPDLTFINEDPLQYSSLDTFDFVVTFPPLGQRFEINGRRTYSELLYIEKALSLLNENGIAIFVLSNNFLTAPIYTDTRNLILNKFGLSKIITLPQGVIRNTGIELSILEIKKSEVPKTGFYKFSSVFDLKTAAPSFSIPKEELFERWDFNFHNPKNKKYQEHLNENETQKIGDLVEICLGLPFNQEERKSKGNYKLLSPRNIINGVIAETPNDYYIDKDNFNEREKKAILKKGDILFPRFNREKVAIYVHSSDDAKYIANQHIVILRGKNAEYVATYLNTDSGLNLFNQQIKRHARGAALPTISLQDLSNIQIPILPIADLEYASKSRLEKLSYNELIEIKKKYDELKLKYANLKNEKAIPFKEQLQSLEQKLLERFDNIESKIDNIQTILDEISNDFKIIKSLPREIDDKISRMTESIDKQLSSISAEQKQIDFYIQEIKKWFEYYELLEFNSQKYLPEAEYILDKISSLENPDYSPFIIQYCRAFENELLNKIFRAYVQSIIDRNLNLETEFAWDFQLKENRKPNDEITHTIVKRIKNFITKDKENWFFELGGMELILRKLTGTTISKSPFLQDLNKFVLLKFKKELLNIQYLDKIKTIITDYRNQSAHPNLIDTEKAMKFHKQIKECLINLMINYKTT